MGVEVEYGVTVQGQPLANHMVASSQVVNAYASATVKARRARWDFEEESPAARRPRVRHVAAGRRPDPAHRRGHGAGQRHPHQRGAALRRPRPPGVLHARGDDPARHRPLGQGRRAGDARRVADGRAGPRHPADPPLQEQHRQQGCVLRRPRELPDAALHAVRRHRAPPDAVLRLAPGDHAAPAGSGSARTVASTATSSPSAPTSSRSRSGWRRRSSGRSSTPATSRTPTRRSTAACTSSSATPTWPRSRPTSRSAPPRSCWR